MSDISLANPEKWAEIKDGVFPSEDLVLYQDDFRMVYFNPEYGPHIPYPPFDHGEGQLNHGYASTKGRPDVIEAILEMKDFPEYLDMLLRINDSESPVESLGCEKLETELDHPRVKSEIGSYTDIAFSSPARSESLDDYLRLALAIYEECDGLQQWWSRIEIAIQRLKHYHGVSQPWCLSIVITGHGLTPEHAREMWAVTAGKVSEACLRFDHLRV